MEWISVSENGLPKPDQRKQYFVLHPNGLGYGTYNFDYDWDPIKKKYLIVRNRARWYLDFDATGNGEKVTHYIEVEYPKEYWNE